MDSAPDNFAHAQSLLEERQYDLALQELLRLVDAAPDDWRAHEMLSECYEGLGDFENTDVHYQAFQRLLPPRIRANNLADAAKQEVQVCDFSKARRLVGEALELDPDNAAALTVSADLHLKWARWRDALTIANQALRIQPGNTDALCHRAVALRMTGQLHEEQRTLGAALAEDSENALVHFTAGEGALMRGDHREAERQFREALRLDAEYETAQIGIAEAIKSANPVYRLGVRSAFLFVRGGKKLKLALIAPLPALLAVIQFGPKATLEPAYAVSMILAGLMLVTMCRTLLGDFLLQFSSRGCQVLLKRMRVAANIVTPLFLISVALLATSTVAEGWCGVIAVSYALLVTGMLIPLVCAVHEPKAVRSIGYALIAVCWPLLLVAMFYGLVGSDFDTFELLQWIAGGFVLLSLLLRSNAFWLRLRR